MRSKFRFILGGLFPILVATVASYAQTPVIEWQTIVSSGEDFSVTVPAGYLVHKDSRSGQVILIGSGGGASFEVGFLKGSSAIKRPELRGDAPSKKGETAEFTINDARVNVYTYQGSKIFRASIWTATKKGFYRLELSAPSLENETLNRILASAKLADTPIVKAPKAEAPVAGTVLQANSLAVSDIVKAALKRKQTESFDVETAGKDYEPEDKEIIYSRRVLVVYKVPAVYNSQARNDGVEGTVRVRILFKANGNIGKVTILKGLPSGLNGQVIDAIRKIKFVPAEVDGVPADAERTLEYTFDIY